MVEFRHRPWLVKPEVLALLRSLNIGLAMARHPWYSRFREATTDFAYLRPFGPSGVFPGFSRVDQPRDDVLREWAGALLSMPPFVGRAFVFANNQFEGYSPSTIERLRAMV